MSVQTLEQTMKEQELRKKSVEPAERTVAVVTLEIKTLQGQAMQSALSYAIQIGMRLVEAKSMVDHGEWGNYVKELGYSQSTAQNLMKIFEEYGDDQLSLFGDPKSQAFGNLSYTKALALLAVPAEEREAFVEENDVDGMSTRELQAAIRERDEARLEKEKAETEQKLAEEARKEMERHAAMANKRVEELQRELEELRARPVEVAVEPMVDKVALAKAKAEATEKLLKELNKAKADAQKAKDALEKEKKAGADKLAKAEEEAKEAEKEKEKAVRQKEQAEEVAEKLRKELAASGNKAVVTFGVHFTAVQEGLAKMLECMEELETAGDRENREKLGKAYTALLDSYRERGQQNGD